MPPSKRPSAGKPARKSPRAATGRAPSVPNAYGDPELVVVAHSDAGIRIRPASAESVNGAAHPALTELVSRNDVTMSPMFGPEDRVLAEADLAKPRAISAVPDLSVYYSVKAPEARLDELSQEFNAINEVAGSYIKPPGEPPVMMTAMAGPAPGDAPPVTPNYVDRQQYLDPAPGGVDAHYAWSRPGGGGADVQIIDCEWAWHFDHEDLVQTQGGVVVGVASTDLNSLNHGTAVIGEISGDRNNIGITGICPDATISAASFANLPTATAIRSAVNRLRPGDLLLLEIHRPGPRHNFQTRTDQLGYIAIEWWPDDFAAIQFATSQGIIVIEAAGNGAENLDDAIYSTPAAGFPTNWTNPYNRANRDSGAIVVGAGAPPNGTHGANWGADRSRLDFSNFGALVDAQGWGREVTTTGYSDLQAGTDQRFWYTDTFGGTSSASPIITGVLGCLQGVLRAMHKPLMTPATARHWLRTSGSPQQDEPGRPATQRIGNRPNLRQLIDIHAKPDKETKEVKEFIKDWDKHKVEFKEAKDKETKERAKDFKEPKEFVEGGKQLSDQNKLADIGQNWRQNILFGTPDTPGSVEQRLSQVEAAISNLTHFITQDMRPDLTSSALSREADIRADAIAAKQNKDYKDKEFLAEQ